MTIEDLEEYRKYNKVNMKKFNVIENSEKGKR